MIHSQRRFLALVALLLCLTVDVDARAPHPFAPASIQHVQSTASLQVRGGAAAVKAVAKKSHDAAGGHHGELMSSNTAIANVLADLCPHGMLPIAFGMAAGGGTGPVLATIVLFSFGVLSWYSLVSFAR
jgi:hypothetical protein